MTLADLRSELEEEKGWRLDELRFLKNQLSEFNTGDDKDRFRRSLVVMLYAHFEGFWKAAFMMYVKALNAVSMNCADAAAALVAAAHSDVFDAMTDSGRKCDFFRNSAPDDSKLHRFSRHKEFAERVVEFQKKKVEIDSELVVNTESNLNPVVIRKNLFRMGFDYDAFKHHEGDVNRLLNYRNLIAHGAKRSGVSEMDYQDLEQAVFSVMNAVVQLVYGAMRERKYLRHRETEYTI